MELGWLWIVVGIIIVVSIVVLMVTLVSPTMTGGVATANANEAAGELSQLLTSNRAAIVPATPTESTTIPVTGPVLSEYRHNTLEVPSPYVPQPTLAPTQFTDVAQREEGSMTEPVGVDASASDADHAYQLASNYPGMMGDGLLLLYPQRREIHLCGKGGFLRRYGGCGSSAWRHIPYIMLEDRRIGYDGKGHFLTGGISTKYLVIEYAGKPYAVEIVQRSSHF